MCHDFEPSCFNPLEVSSSGSRASTCCFPHFLPRLPAVSGSGLWSSQSSGWGTSLKVPCAHEDLQTKTGLSPHPCGVNSHVFWWWRFKDWGPHCGNINVVPFSRPSRRVWRLFCLTLSLRAVSHALKTDVLADTSASAGVVLHVEQSCLPSKPYCLTSLSKKEAQ